MSLFAFPLLALAPGIFWLWFFLRRRAYRPHPRRLLALTFALGMLSTLPAGALEFAILRGGDPTEGSDLATLALAMLFVVGPVEEGCKFAVVRLVPYRSLYFDEPLAGLSYSAAASLGFASLENLVYMLAQGPLVLVGRGPISTLAHLVFGSVWGYALGRQAPGGRGAVPVLVGVAGAALLHGLFNVAVFAFPPLVIPLVFGGAVWVATRFDWAQRVSPFRLRRNYPLVECGACGRRVRVNSRYCRFCGAPIVGQRLALFCGLCATPNRPDAAYCARCGDRFLT